MSETASTEMKKERTLTGKVVSSKMDKTAVVVIVRKIQHPLYKKYITKSTKLSVHDESNACSEGDVVRIKSTRPYSKNKSWALVDIVEKARA